MKTKGAAYKTLEEAEKALPEFSKNGITEFVLHEAADNKNALLKFLAAVQKYCPSLYLTIPILIGTLDREVAGVCSDLFCSLDIPFTGTSKHTKDGDIYLFDKKKFAGKIAMLNDMGLVFGFDMDWAVLPGDSIKLFRERFEFALSLYPNHIEFAQLESAAQNQSADAALVKQNQTAVAQVNKNQPAAFTAPVAKPTATFSSQDIRQIRDLAFACKTFYSCGRAVPWFLSVLAPLKIQCHKFFSDFAEWQRCNNCSYSSGFSPDAVSHAEIEKMQLLFLAEKFEEKHKESLFTVVKDIVRLNGAFSRLAGEGEASELDLSYNPEDLFSPESCNIQSFADNVLLEPCRVKVFEGHDGPDFKIIG